MRYETCDRDEAEQIVADLYLPNRLRLITARSQPLRTELTGARFGEVTAGMLSFGSEVTVVGTDRPQFTVGITMKGRAMARSGFADPVVTTVGQATILQPEEPGQFTWSKDCVQLILMVSRFRLEEELERLLGRSVVPRLAFESRTGIDLGGLWRPILDYVQAELSNPSGLTRYPMLVRHMEGLIVDGLLLSHPHNHQKLLSRGTTSAPVGAIGRAAALLEEKPGEAWTVVGLAREVNLSVRALQNGFRRDFDLSPKEYLQQVRLRRARAALLASAPGSTTVQAVANTQGFFHLGRFASSYRQAFGEMPSATLGRR